MKAVRATARGITLVGTVLKGIIIVGGSLVFLYMAFQAAKDGEWLIAALIVFVLEPIFIGIADILTGLILIPFALIAGVGRE